MASVALDSCCESLALHVDLTNLLTTFVWCLKINSWRTSITRYTSFIIFFIMWIMTFIRPWHSLKQLAVGKQKCVCIYVRYLLCTYCIPTVGSYYCYFTFRLCDSKHFWTRWYRHIQFFSVSEKLNRHLRTRIHHQSPHLDMREDSSYTNPVVDINTSLLAKGSLWQTAVGAVPETLSTTPERTHVRLKSSQVSEAGPSRQDCFGETCCQYCSLRNFSKSSLNRHMKEMHPEVPVSYPYNCAECGRGFFSQSGLNYHMDSHFGKSECAICSRTFKYSRNLKRHLELIHLMKECRQCKNYIIGDNFRSHILNCTRQPNTHRWILVTFGVQ